MDIKLILEVTELEDLKRMGKMLEIKNEIQKHLGSNLKIKIKSWDDLFEIIQNLNSLLKILSNGNLKTIESETNLQLSNTEIEYFKTPADKLIYALVELKGEERKEKLKITPFCYQNKKYAKKWRDEILKIVHPDVTNHPKANEAIDILQDFYERMLSNGRK